MRKFILGFIIASFVWCGISYAMRLSTPPKFTLPWKADDVVQLNDYLDNIFNLTNGRFSINIFSSDPANPKNGDIWILESGSTHRFKWHAGDTTYYVDGN